MYPPYALPLLTYTSNVTCLCTKSRHALAVEQVLFAVQLVAVTLHLIHLRLTDQRHSDAQGESGSEPHDDPTFANLMILYSPLCQYRILPRSYPYCSHTTMRM